MRLLSLITLVTSSCDPAVTDNRQLVRFEKGVISTPHLPQLPQLVQRNGVAIGCQTSQRQFDPVY